jgi:hypothetical protein
VLAARQGQEVVAERVGAPGGAGQQDQDDQVTDPYAPLAAM